MREEEEERVGVLCRWDSFTWKDTRTGWRREALSLLIGDNILSISLTCIQAVAFGRNRGLEIEDSRYIPKLPS